MGLRVEVAGSDMRAYKGCIGFTYRGLYRDNGKENGNYYLGFRV